MTLLADNLGGVDDYEVNGAELDGAPCFYRGFLTGFVSTRFTPLLLWNSRFITDEFCVSADETAFTVGADAELFSVGAGRTC